MSNAKAAVALLRTADGSGKCSFTLANSTPLFLCIRVNGRETKAHRSSVKRTGRVHLANTSHRESLEGLSSAVANRAARNLATSDERQSHSSDLDRRAGSLSRSEVVSDSAAKTDARASSQTKGGSSGRSHDNTNAASAAHGSGFARSHQTASAAGSGSSNQFERSHHFDHLDSSHNSRGLHDASHSSDLQSHHQGSSNANSHSHNAHGGGGVTAGSVGVNGNGGSGESNSHHTSNVAGATNGTERGVSRASETADTAAKRRAGGSSSAGGQSHHAHRSDMNAGSDSGNRFDSRSHANRSAASAANTHHASQSLHEATGLQEAHSRVRSHSLTHDESTGRSRGQAVRNTLATGQDQSDFREGAATTKTVRSTDRSTDVTLSTEEQTKHPDFDDGLDIVCLEEVAPGHWRKFEIASQVQGSNLYLEYALKKLRADGTVHMEWRCFPLPSYNQAASLIVTDTQELVPAASPTCPWIGQDGCNHLSYNADALLTAPNLARKGEWLRAVLAQLYSEDPRLALDALTDVARSTERVNAFLAMVRNAPLAHVRQLVEVVFKLMEVAGEWQYGLLCQLCNASCRVDKRLYALVAERMESRQLQALVAKEADRALALALAASCQSSGKASKKEMRPLA